MTIKQISNILQSVYHHDVYSNAMTTKQMDTTLSYHYMNSNGAGNDIQYPFFMIVIMTGVALEKYQTKYIFKFFNTLAPGRFDSHF